MATKPRQIRVMPSTAPTRMPWTKSKDAPKRLAGRQLQERNARIKARDLYTCSNDQCGVHTVHGNVDHKLALAHGGTEDEDNLQWLCTPCNAAKGLAESRGIVLDNPSSFNREEVRRMRVKPI